MLTEREASAGSEHSRVKIGIRVAVWQGVILFILNGIVVDEGQAL